MANEVEVLVNADGRVAIIIEALASAPVSYQIAHLEQMVLNLVCADGSLHAQKFPETARDSWQKVIDNEELLVTEVDTSSDEVTEDSIVRDRWLKPYGD